MWDKMESFDDLFLDYSSFMNDAPSNDLFWSNQSPGLQLDANFFEITTQVENCIEEEFPRKSPGLQLGANFFETTAQVENCIEKEIPRKRGRTDSCDKLGTKACRERLRREKLNERFLELSSILEPERVPKTDKLAILDDAMRVLNQLRAESQEYKETNGKLLDEIKSLKAEKNELREEKNVLKAENERMEQQMKAVVTPSPGFLPPHPAAYHAGPAKMAVYPSYGFVPMWQYLPPSARDTSKDHDLRPPAA